MRLSRTSISCGIRTLSNIGNDPTQEEIDRIMRNVETPYYNTCAIIIASLTKHQLIARKLLLKNGFQQGEWRQNPNTGNNISIFVKYVGKRKNKSKGSRKKYVV